MQSHTFSSNLVGEMKYLVQSVCVVACITTLGCAVPVTKSPSTTSDGADGISAGIGASNLSLPVAERSIGGSCCTQDVYIPWRNSRKPETDPIDRVLCPYVMRCHCDPDFIPSQYWVAELDGSKGTPLCEKEFSNAHCQPMDTIVGFIAKKGADGKDINNCESAKPMSKTIAASFICMADGDQLTFRQRPN